MYESLSVCVGVCLSTIFIVSASFRIFEVCPTAIQSADQTNRGNTCGILFALFVCGSTNMSAECNHLCVSVCVNHCPGWPETRVSWQRTSCRKDVPISAIYARECRLVNVFVIYTYCQGPLPPHPTTLEKHQQMSNWRFNECHLTGSVQYTVCQLPWCSLCIASALLKSHCEPC